MIDVGKLRGVIAERWSSQRQVAKHLGMSERTFYSKMKRGVFGSDEMEGMISFLRIENPSEIFFAKVGS